MAVELAAVGVRETQRASIPDCREATAEEVAKVAPFLARDDSAYWTGGESVIDGGRTA